MIVTARYNTAVSYFRLPKTDDARQFAEKIVTDDEFGARAQELLARLRLANLVRTRGSRHAATTYRAVGIDGIVPPM
jgi:hypothetical protein